MSARRAGPAPARGRGRGAERPRTTWVGVLEKRGRFWSATPFFERGRRATVAGGRNLRPGGLVLLVAGGGGKAQAKVVRDLGRSDRARDVLEALLLDRGLQRRFDPAVEREAREAAARVDGAVARRDLRHLPTFTIDPTSARDFDDAISAEALAPGRTRIWVHIADVAAHVPPGSLVDREAYRRATSVYVPGLVEPMLPEALSNVACSLVPGQERLAVTVEMDLRGATVERAAFHRSLIVSDARLDYDQVDRVFAGSERAQEPWAAPLAAARGAAAALRAAREGRDALTLEDLEPEFAFDPEGAVVGVHAAAQTESHRVIEHLMIAANEQVATLLAERGLPALYRVHERPQPEAVERLVAQLASLDVPTPPVPDRLSPQQAADLAGELSQAVDAHVRRTGRGRLALTSLVLRTLKQAYYSPVNIGHAGLQSPRYCHFTSPIRRYPDLVCHRALLAAVGGGEAPPRASDLPAAGEWCSARERAAVEIERDADDVARCFLLERELFHAGHDHPWEGEVVSLIGAGAFVAFGDGYEGLLPARRLRGDWWELNEEGTILRGERSGRAIRLGDPVPVRVGRIDVPRGRVDLYPAE